MLRKGQFTIDDETAYEGYTTGETWNGWACPMFTREVAEQITATVKAEDWEGGTVTFDEYLQTFVWESEGITETTGFSETFDFTDTEHGRLYPIGAGSWIWSEVKEAGETPPEPADEEPDATYNPVSLTVRITTNEHSDITAAVLLAAEPVPPLPLPFPMHEEDVFFVAHIGMRLYFDTYEESLLNLSAHGVFDVTFCQSVGPSITRID